MRARQAGGRGAGVGLAVLVLFGVAVVGLPEFARAGSKEYTGTVVGDPLATVHFTVVGPRRRPQSATFEAANIQLFYDDGTTGLYSTVFPNTAFFVNSRTFRYVEFGFHAAVTSFYELEGRLLPNGRSRGSLIYMANYFEPPAPIASGLPDASTHGPVYWEASRTG